MRGTGTQEIVDYTTLPIGLRIEGRLWTGQPTESTSLCPKCKRTGVSSARQEVEMIIVHTGRVIDGMLEGIDYCKIVDERMRPLAE